MGPASRLYAMMSARAPMCLVAIAKGDPDLSMPTVEKPGFATFTEAAYSRIREDILSGSLSPGEKLRLDKLRELYGFGLSPLREALSKLSSERLVRSSGQRGYWVEPISRKEFADITEARLLLEPEALARSVERRTPDWEESCDVAFHRLLAVERTLDNDRVGLSAAWEKANRDFHFAIIRNSGSEWVMLFVTMLFEQSERYRRLAVQRLAVPAEVLLREHQAIHEAARGGNGRLAAELLRVHIRNAARGVEAMLFSEGSA